MSEHKIAWATDIHLDFAIPRGTFEEFCQKVNNSGAQTLLITGDITEGDKIEKDLTLLARKIPMPIYFVLGNHDYYHSSFASVAERVSKLTASVANLTWMDSAGVVELTPNYGLVGFGGWSDGRAGNYYRSYRMNDHTKIADFRELDEAQILKKMMELGDESADYFGNILPQAFDRYNSVVALTHCPPFVEACYIEGYKGSKADLPHFSCPSVGEIMKNVMRKNPEKKLTVLSGHTHSPVSVEILPNLSIYVGVASYGYPDFTIFSLNT